MTEEEICFIFELIAQRAIEGATLGQIKREILTTLNPAPLVICEDGGNIGEQKRDRAINFRSNRVVRRDRDRECRFRKSSFNPGAIRFRRY